MERGSPFQLECPLPLDEYPHVLLAHGGGGRLMHMLLERLFFPALGSSGDHDGALLEVGGVRLAFTTDAFVVSPWRFPGGDIGSLAVHGTVNDLAACGARPLALATAFILEEGFPVESVWEVARSAGEAATRVGVPVVTGDTKVVDRGKGDGIFVITTGVGVVPEGVDVAPARARPGDVIVINGFIADHGIAIMSVREGLAFETTLQSDSAPLHDLVAAVLEVARGQVHVMRDPTRGGVATALNEIARVAGVGIELDEASLPVRPEVQGACELLGLDPLYVANEGKMLFVIAPDVAEHVLEAMRGHPLGQDAAVIGRVVDEHPGRVVMRSRIGGRRVVDVLSGEQLPRIC